MMLRSSSGRLQPRIRLKLKQRQRNSRTKENECSNRSLQNLAMTYYSHRRRRKSVWKKLTQCREWATRWQQSCPRGTLQRSMAFLFAECTVMLTNPNWGESRSPLAAVFHSAPKLNSVSLTNPNFLSVGEWVEVDGDITPGFNSEGGIAVIINVLDNFAGVNKYVIPPCHSLLRN